MAERDRARRQRTAAPLALLTLAAVLLTVAVTALSQEQGPPAPLESGADAPYVHRITLYDVDGRVVDPDAENPKPYSPMVTCGKCHDVAAVHDGWHFNAWDPDVEPGRPGEPWIYVDEETGEQIPLSARGWPGTQTPQSIGMSQWDFVTKFGHHLPGGYPRDDIPGYEPDPDARWQISGKLEVDCMICHAADRSYDPAEWARQVEKQNFKWAPTVALGLGAVVGEASKLQLPEPDAFDMSQFDPAAPAGGGAEQELTLPLRYDKSRFDAEQRVFFNITRDIPSTNCLYCHSTREVGPAALPRWHTDEDVHLKAGMNCTDCHRNDIEHDIVRGYRDEWLEAEVPQMATLTCAGCHDSGRMGSPIPQHAGLPPLHLEKMTCTACHAGPMPDMSTAAVQTSLNHSLGIGSRDRTAEMPPHIVAPVFLRDQDGRIAPHKMLVDGEPGYAWPLGHDVRPASQSLGVTGCAECHSEQGAVYFSTVNHPAYQQRELGRQMIDLRGESRSLAQAWNVGFGQRPIFKWFAFIGTGLVGVLLLIYSGTGLMDLIGRLNPNRPVPPHVEPGVRPWARWLNRLGLVVMLLGFAILATTGGGTIAAEGVGSLHGWWLWTHFLGAPLFIAGLSILIVLVGEQHRFHRPPRGSIRKLAFWTFAWAGFMTIATILLGMVNWFAAETQYTLYTIHRVAALTLSIAMVIYLIAWWRGRREIG